MKIRSLFLHSWSIKFPCTRKKAWFSGEHSETSVGLQIEIMKKELKVAGLRETWVAKSRWAFFTNNSGSCAPSGFYCRKRLMGVLRQFSKKIKTLVDEVQPEERWTCTMQFFKIYSIRALVDNQDSKTTNTSNNCILESLPETDCFMLKVWSQKEIQHFGINVSWNIGKMSKETAVFWRFRNIEIPRQRTKRTSSWVQLFIRVKICQLRSWFLRDEY